MARECKSLRIKIANLRKILMNPDKKFTQMDDKMLKFQLKVAGQEIE